MPRCCVPKCSGNGVHHFPRDNTLKKAWLKAIRRNKFNPTKNSRLCRNHFLESDYLGRSSYTNVEHLHKFLEKTAVPSIFPWNNKPVSENAAAREERLQNRNAKKVLFQQNTTLGDNVVINPQPSTSQAFQAIPSSESHVSCGTQTNCVMRFFSTDFSLEDEESVMFYTGLESYAKFSMVLSTLLPMANNLQYRWHQVKNLSVEDQFCILLIKLRRNKADFELAKMFAVSKTEIANIVVTWINFVSDMWRLLDIWPSRELVNFYMPQAFHKDYKNTRVIVDGTEIPIQKPSHPDAQKATFSTYKHKNTLKFLVGSSPSGLISYVSEGYAGSVSDRQIVERSDLINLCEPGDMIMADRGFNVQDLFIKKNITINIPTFLRGRSQIPGILLRNDQKLASQRVHIERLIGLTKTYKILTSDLNQHYVPLASKIFHICIMLCNFKEGIVVSKRKSHV